ncbi:hypothetical protein OLX02_05445 [Novosphingobium sp. KCTC 2891]|uniref:hypothetical protein n=1 Tax=Novosphingobium sp. KCTC 2891 TaxID=2989730 RepID=UPI002223429E|nr:hypothetical protein [Novosphingobium sp. KCTC 2891]MCW1382259.1 hypothetical protein [Novosphingobium sp. KCTC 2891]
MRGQPRAIDFARSAMLAVLGCALAAAVLAAIRWRSPWYDEFYTLYVTRPGVPLGMLWHAWLADNHPPLFYALAWVTNAPGAHLEIRRLLNVGILIGAAGALGLVAWRRPPLRTTLFAYAAGLCAAVPMVDRAADLRSYFLSFCAGAVAVAALAAFVKPGERLPRRAALFLAASLLAALTVHIVTTLIVGTLVGAFCCWLLLAGDRAGALRLAGIAALAAVPAAMGYALQFAVMNANTRAFWIDAGWEYAYWIIRGETVSAAFANPVLTLGGCCGLAWIALRDGRVRRLSPELGLILTLGFGTALVLVLLFAMHTQRPIVVGRYLVAIYPPILMALATGWAALCSRIGARWTVAVEALLVAAALAALQHNVSVPLKRTGWDASGAAIARIAAACPGTKIHMNTAWNGATLALAPAENLAVVPYAYRLTAARHGFALEQPGSRAMGGPCPAVFWSEHVTTLHPTADDIARDLRRRGYQVHHGYLRRIGDGLVFVGGR